MAETIRLNVATAGEAAVIASLENIDKLAAQLRKPISIQINSNASKELTQLINAQAKLAKAEADSAKAQARIAEAEEKTRQARLGLLRETQRLNIETAKQETESRKAATAAAQEARATAQLAVQQERTATQIERTNVETARAATEQARLATQTERTATEQARFVTQQERTRTAQERVIRGTQQTTREHNLLGDSLGNIAMKMAVWQVMGTLISAPLRSLREAVQTMKDVDTELTNIQKVTNMSDADIKALGSNAYSVASQYGVAANDYLSNVSAFSKAGYGEIADELGELAVKTQLVGDVTADMANKMILSVDAAYDLKGNVTDLNTVLDKMNIIENNYATSIEKITEGMPIVANVASMAGMSIDEITAMLGTITAVTQESGAGAARAARALILNIIGDTETEIEDGVTWTKEEVESLNDVLRVYSSEALKAADATGKVVNPMEAVAGLSEAYKEGVLSEAKLMEIASDLGGKLRTNQLLALIENFDMYKDMLNTMSDAAGSADEEIGVMLDSWEAKSNILKNTWTEFISNLVETDAIKGFLDVGTGVIKFLDSGVGKFIALTAALSLAERGFIGVGRAIGNTKIWTDLADAIAMVREGTVTATGAAKGFAKAIISSPNFWIAAFSGLITIINQVRNNLREARQEAVDAGKEATDTAREIITLYGEYDALRGALLDTDEDKKAFADTTSDLLKLLGYEDDEIKKLSGDYEGLREAIANASAEQLTYKLSDAKAAVTAAERLVRSTKGSLTGTESKISDIAMRVGNPLGTIADYEKLLDMIREARDESSKNGGRWVAVGYRYYSFEKVSEMYTILKERIDAYNEAVKAEKELEGMLIAVDDKVVGVKEQEATEAVKLERAQKTLSAAMDEYAEKGKLSEQTVNALSNAIPGLVDALYDEEGNLTAVGKAALGDTDAMAALIEASYSVQTALGNMNLSTAIQKLADMEAAFYATAIAARTMSQAMAISNMKQAIGEAQAEIRAVIASSRISTGGGGGGSSGGGSGSSSASSTDPQLEAYKKRVELLKSELALLEKQDAPAEARLAKIAEIQDALTAQSGYMQKSGSEQSDINAVFAEWWDYSKQTESIRDGLWDDLIDNVKGILSAAEELSDTEEKRLALEDAQAALEKAKQQRNVRAFTGGGGVSWEWIANEGDVEKAQKAADDAQKAFDDALIDKDLADLVAAKGLDMSSIVVGSALAAKLASISEEETRDTANALHALYGTADFTPKAAPQSSIMTHDSHDTAYYFPGGITIGAEQAETLTLAGLARQLKVLKTM